MKNKNLHEAKVAKKDEFYTRMEDIGNELKHYRDFFRGKSVLCNCDDPYESNFFKFFALNFNAWGLRKLVATCYDGSPIAGQQLELPFDDMGGTTLLSSQNTTDTANGIGGTTLLSSQTPTDTANDIGGTTLLSSQNTTGTAKGMDRQDCRSSYLTNMENSMDRQECRSSYGDAHTKIAYKIEITEVPDMNGDGAVDMTDVDILIRSDKNVLTKLRGNGDFRSAECVEMLREADVVVTNPPFSLFREYVAQLVEYDKKFLILGNKNAITYKEIFPLIKDNKLWTGYRNFSGGMWFKAVYEGKTEKTEDGQKLINVPSIWFTNIDHKKRHEKLDLYKSYTPEEYPTYDNYNAINVDKTADIPMDYYGVMGVPITFMDKYNPEQFEILGITKTWFGAASKIYPEQIQVDKNGKETTVSKLNDGSVLEIPHPLAGKTYYKVGGKLYIQTYARILIKRKP